MSLQAITKEYNFRPVLDEITFDLEPGMRYALTGENGLGKTTLLKIMAGLSRPTRGQILWDGEIFCARHRRHIGVVMQQPFLYGDLTGSENLQLYATLYDCENPKMTSEKWLDLFHLTDAKDMKVKEYSKGMKQRLSLSRALIHTPSVLLLDEPYDGLDEKSAYTVNQILDVEACCRTSIFLVTHQVNHVQRADRHLTLRNGRLVNAV